MDIKMSRTVIPPIPRGLLIGIYVLYIGMATTSSVPLFADIDWLHEGERVGAAQIILNGGLPYRDAFFTHGIFPEGLQPLIAFKLFGESIAADRLFGLVLAPLAYVAAVFYICKVFPSVGWRITGLIGFALYPLLLVPRHIVVFLALGLLTAWVYEQQRAQLMMAGILTGLGFITSSIEHAFFLLGTILLFPFVLAAEKMPLARGQAEPVCGHTGSVGSMFLDVARPLFLGVILGLLPFLAYLWLTGTAGDFIDTFVIRLQFNSYITQHEVYPSLQLMNMTWYVIPAFYVVLTVVMTVSVLRAGGGCWGALWPTLLFGLLSYSYATRKYTYWALAVVSFPFIISFIYVLYVIAKGSSDAVVHQDSKRLKFGEQVLLGFSAISMGGLIVHALLREWTAKQAVPRVLLPALALLTLAATVTAAVRRVRRQGWYVRFVVACPLAALIIATWYFNEAQPQLATVLIKKPRLVKDVRRLVRAVAAEGGALTREHPVYVQDEVLAYLKEVAREQKKVVILAAGSGVYYFLAGATPPTRFPEVNHAQADISVGEVIEGLERTRAELLVGCREKEQAAMEGPINPRLSKYIGANYVDSGRRLSSAMLGEVCPFSVWVHREVVRGTRS